MGEIFAEALTREQLAKMARLLSDPTAAEMLLPTEERERYQRAQESVVRGPLPDFTNGTGSI